MRNCDPGADIRMLPERASLCRKNEPELCCHEQQVTVPSPHRLFAATHECSWPSLLSHGVETLGDRAWLVVDAIGDCMRPTRCSAPSREIAWFPSCSLVCSDFRHRQHAIQPFGRDCSPDRNAPLFVLLMPLSVQSLSAEYDPRLNRRAPHAVRGGMSNVAKPDPRRGLRTHSFIRVSDEKRNVDECSAARGKPSCHR